MSRDPRATAQTLQAAGLWPSLASDDPDGGPALARLELLLGGLPEPLATAISDGLVDPERNTWARAAIQALTLAGTAGLSPATLCEHDLLGVTDRAGVALGIAITPLHVDEHASGRPEDVRRLTSAL